MSDGAVSIDIIVPVYKNAEVTVRCLNSLADNMHEIAECNPRIIIINDSPGEQGLANVLEGFARRNAQVTILSNDRNLGFVGTTNRGLAIASNDGRDAILVNSDTVTFRDTLRNLVDAAYADPQIGFASPRSNKASFCSLPLGQPEAVTTPEEAYRQWRLLSRSMPAFHFAPTAVGFYLYIKQSIIANCGLLDESFGVGYEEENDLILRANKLGYRAVLANNAFAYHEGSASFDLLDVNLLDHRAANLQRISERHREFLPLVRRYEQSAHFQAETLLSSSFSFASNRLKIVFDLSSVGPSIDGTSEMSVAIIGAFCDRHAGSFDINVICSEKSFAFHQLDRHKVLRRREPEFRDDEKFSIGVRLSQPFSVNALKTIEDMSAVNIYGMLDTIADDCGYLSITHQLETLWGHASRHANGLFFNSRFSERAFLTRYPSSRNLPRYVRLLPTKLRNYQADGSMPHSADHVLILGNQFAHKASESAAAMLGTAFPNLSFVVMGRKNGLSGNVRTFQSGTVALQNMGLFYARARIVVLPSHVEGFGFGLVHALAARKVVVARDIPVTREILATYGQVSGVFLFANDKQLIESVRMAMQAARSFVDDSGSLSETWNDWVDGFATFCSSLLEQSDLFDRIVGRIRSGELLRKAELADLMRVPASTIAPTKERPGSDGKVRHGGGGIKDTEGREWLPARGVGELLALDGDAFIHCAYVTILKRLPDSDGLINYLVELHSGVPKVEIVSRLLNSPEGRSVGVSLQGYKSAMLRNRIVSLLRSASKAASRSQN